MDEAPAYLSQNPGGVAVVGLATCYAFIITNGQDTAAMHVSPIRANIEYVEDIFSQFQKNSSALIEVTLVRSFKSYEQALQNDKENGYASEHPSPKNYFQSEDKEYVEYFTKKFKIIPRVIDAPHGTVVITKEHKIRLFERANDIFFEETEVPSNTNNLSRNILLT